MKSIWRSQPDSLEQLNILSDSVEQCTMCELCDARRRVVVGEGDPDARLMFVGESPGVEENISGRPFSGHRAGEIFDRMIASMGLQRESIYVTNVVKCMPPGGRSPTIEEAGACHGWLEQQIRIVKPRVVITLGNVPTQMLLQVEVGISRIRGQVWPLEYPHGIVCVVPTFHPGFLLRHATDRDFALVDHDLKRSAELLNPQLVL